MIWRACTHARLRAHTQVYVAAGRVETFALDGIVWSSGTAEGAS